MDYVWRHTEVGHAIALPILGPSGPPVPPLGRCVHQAYVRVMIKRRDLALEFLRQRSIVGVE